MESPTKFNPASQKRQRRSSHGHVVSCLTHCKVCRKLYDTVKGACKRTKKCRQYQAEERKTAMINTGECFRGWYEHLGPKPIYIESKTQLYDECKKRGLEARALMSGGVMKDPRRSYR